MSAAIKSVAAAPDENPSCGKGRQPAVIEDLPPWRREQVAFRVEHLREADTGYRSGTQLDRQPGEPRPPYDPETTTLTQRRKSKATELTAITCDPQVSKLLGLRSVGYRTLLRWSTAYRLHGPIGCADARWLRVSPGRISITGTIAEAMQAVHNEEIQHRSRLSMATRYRLVCQYVSELHCSVQVPSYDTVRVAWYENFGPGGARQRYKRSSGATPDNVCAVHVTIGRPGQVIAMDTTVLPVKVLETTFAEPATVNLTLALDVYTRSILAFRLTLVSDRSIDVAMVLRDVMTPRPMRAGWDDDMRWRYPGVPGDLIAEQTGYPVACLPFLAPEIITTDHGSVYKNHHLVNVEHHLGVNILPARVMRPTDKQAVERTFGGIRSLLFELLPGYQGVDVADAGPAPQPHTLMNIDEMENLIATWVIKVWQNRALGEHCPIWDPAARHSPNTLFAAAMAQGGFALQVPPPQLFYQLLPAHLVAIHSTRGVKIRGLWYDGPALNPYRARRSARSGVRKGTWVIRSDPRDRRTVFFQDPGTHHWCELRWSGLAGVTDVPSFSDARTQDLLRQARQQGLRPRSDTELLPLLLQLLARSAPVGAWPEHDSRQRRKAAAREAQQGKAALADLPGPSRPASVKTLSRDAAIRGSIDQERRRRRERAVPQTPASPVSLGEWLAHRNPMAIPAS